MTEANSHADVAREIERFLSEPIPDGAKDERDLGVIALANELPGATEADLFRLITRARRNGRSWEDISWSLELTASQAEAAYECLAEAAARELDKAADKELMRTPARDVADGFAALLMAIGGVVFAAVRHLRQARGERFHGARR